VTTAASQDEQPQARPGGATRSDPQPQQAVRIEKLLGSPVVNSKGDKVGKIEDVLLDQTGNYYAVVSVGGFLGIGAKDVALPLSDLQLGQDEAYLMSAETEDQLKQSPSTMKTKYQPYAQK
jgi:uncharacterized protein YrrD